MFQTWQWNHEPHFFEHFMTSFYGLQEYRPKKTYYLSEAISFLWAPFIQTPNHYGSLKLVSIYMYVYHWGVHTKDST